MPPGTVTNVENGPQNAGTKRLVPKAMGPKYSIERINFSWTEKHVIKKIPCRISLHGPKAAVIFALLP
jgi:hypothetical protein